jgi:hypothetical protein
MTEYSIWIRNEKLPVNLAKNEFIGPVRQSTWIDPLSKSDYVHKGRTVEELEQEGYVGVWMLLKDFGVKNDLN